MRRVLPTLAAVMLIAFVWVMPVAADWIIDDGHKMHYPQLPDVVGWDVNATNPIILADDWECSETGWVKDVHFWGSWMGGVTGQIISFNLSIHADIPADQNPDGYSKPGATLWEREITDFIIADPVDPPGWQGWYDPAQGAFFFEDHEAYFQYNVFLPEEDWFWQDSGTIYWLNISATVAEPAVTQWGVKSTLDHWNDDAVWSYWGELFWIDMYVPPNIYAYLPGDVNGDGVVDIGDLNYLISFLTMGGPPPVYSIPGVSPPFYAAADVNGDCVVDLGDVTYLQTYLGGGGPAPSFCPSYPPQMLGESLDLAFVITGGEETGACCYPDPTNGDMLCVITDPTTCGQTYGGIWEGPGTTCGGMEACCLPDGSCVMADALCCVNELGGTPQGAGTACSAFEACCLPDGTCADLDPLCCMQQGGAPQGVGTMCTQTVACCLPDGTCLDVDPLCCDDLGGWISPFSQVCLGDNNGNSIDDACEEEEEGACCYTDPPSPDMYCTITTQLYCEQTLGGVWQGPGSVCQGMQACCLQDGSCVMADALCCVNELGGTPQGPGTACAEPQACCMPDGSCRDLDPLCCIDQGGTPQGAGTVCTQTVACCLPGGGCVDVDPLCCDDLGGWISPYSQVCLGDNNGNSIDDACEEEEEGACCYTDPPSPDMYCTITTQLYCEQTLGGIWEGPGTTCGGMEACCLQDGSCVMADVLCCVNELGGTPQGPGSVCTALEACCMTDGTCMDLDPLCCIDQGGTPQGPGTVCLGDHNGDGVDDQCGPGWGPDDPHKMHYPQLPDEAGWDVNATAPLVLADDWMCSETGWVKDVHFWGSWRHGDEGQITSFVLSIHRDIPAEQNPDGYSKPGETLWEREVSRFQALPIDPPTSEGWYDPMQQLVLPGDHQAYFQYNIYLDSIDWFWQQAGTIYWLNISAVIQDPINTQWGWKSSLDHWNDDAVWAEWGDLFWVDMYEPPEFLQSMDLSFVITGEAPDLDTCEYYKDGYLDYCPNGVPDFDQKQDNWISPITGSWSWCGPVALANCLWWFDSKFEPSPVSPVPFGVVPPDDDYPLVPPFGQWDDHDPNNVMPFIQALMPMCLTDAVVPGTSLPDLDAGVHNWIAAQGLAGQYTTYVVLGPEFYEVRDSILSCQDVILLLGFYELFPTGECQWLGGHWVTSAGVCTETTDICISDPMLDKNEGGMAHGAAVHNDAALVSGPHGTNHHDRYNLIPNQWPCPSPATWQFTDYPNDAAFVMSFQGQNPIDPVPIWNDYLGNEIIVLLDAALIICPADTGCCIPPIRGDVNYDGGAIIDIADLVYLTDYMFSGGPEPPCYDEADVVPSAPPLDISDLVYLVDYMFTGGPPPPACP